MVIVGDAIIVLSLSAVFPGPQPPAQVPDFVERLLVHPERCRLHDGRGDLEHPDEPRLPV